VLKKSRTGGGLSAITVLFLLLDRGDNLRIKIDVNIVLINALSTLIEGVL
jgi:hypothetical protein